MYMLQPLSKKKYDKKYYAETAFNKKYHKRWEDWEIYLIMGGDNTDTMLSKILGRSVHSIQLKRSRYIKENYPEYKTVNGQKSVV